MIGSDTNMGDKNTARFDSDQGHPWDVVMGMADEISGELRKKGYSSQDIAHIGLRLTHLGNFMWIVEGTEHMKHTKSETPQGEIPGEVPDEAEE